MTECKESNQNPMPEKGPALWGWHTALSLLVTGVIFAVLAAYVDVPRLWQELSQSRKGLLLLAALSHYATYPVRGMRWRQCLAHLPVQCSNARFGLLVYFYNFVDNLVPAKLGDLYAGHLARINCGIRRSAALGSILFLRTTDAWIVLLLAVGSSWALFARHMPKTIVWVLAAGGAFALIVTVVMVTFVIFKRSLPHWIPQKIQQMIKAFQTGMWPTGRALLPIAGYTAIIWTLEVLWIFLLVLAFGPSLGLAEVIFATMIPLIATAFPVTPSGAGAVELTLYTCLRIIGIPAPLAMSLTVVNRFIDYWLHIATGALVWAFRRRIGLRTWRDVPLDSLPGNGQCNGGTTQTK